MPDAIPQPQRQAAIDAEQMRAVRLLQGALPEALQQQVRLAIRDLQEAGSYLRRETINEQPAMLAIVDMATRLASLRLDTVERAVRAQARDAAGMDR